MQLGSRWTAGAKPHPGVPELLYAAVAESECAHPSGTSWTLTWLEGRPRAELLDLSGEVLADLRVDSSGRVTIGSHSDPIEAAEIDDDDDWLA